MDNDKSEKNEMTESITSVSESTINKETIEERYNKLRGLAVKLKKKVSDLSDQIKQLESEKTALHNEKDEMQQKIIQISNNAKKIQTIQLEYDKLQDKFEQQKSENKKLMKNIETLVDENASLKESLYNEKDSTSQLSTKSEQLIKDKSKLENTIKHLQEQIKSLSEELSAENVIREQKVKEYDALKINFESEIQGHKTTRSQLEAIKQNHTNSNVLSLEVENYEKSIEEMKLKLKDEEANRKSLEHTINEHLETISLLNKQMNEMRSSCLKKTNQVTNLEERNENIKAEVNEMRLETERMQREIQDFLLQLKDSQNEKTNLLKKIESLETNREILTNEFKTKKDILENQLRDITTEISHLNSALTNSKKETENLKEEFSGYKRRAQSVLRTKQNQNKEIGVGGKSIVEIEEELLQSQQQNKHFQEKLEIYEQKLEMLSKELMILKEEKNRTLESLTESNRRQLNSRQEISSLTEQYRSQEIKIEKIIADHKKELENLQKNHKTELRATREHFEQQNHDLKFELEKLKLTEFSDTPRVISQERNFEYNTDSSQQTRLQEIPLIEREECEGSESIDSCPIVLTNGERYRKHSLIPLDELLNSSDDYNPTEIQPVLPQKVSRQEFEVCERRVKHLTVLLADAERDIAKLTQLNEILKEDIRRQQRSVEREQHANNFEYLKNVVFKFVTLKNGDEKNHLIPVLNTILKLSPEETQKLYSVAGGKSWIPGLL